MWTECIQNLFVTLRLCLFFYSGWADLLERSQEVRGCIRQCLSGAACPQPLLLHQRGGVSSPGRHDGYHQFPHLQDCHAGCTEDWRRKPIQVSGRFMLVTVGTLYYSSPEFCSWRGTVFRTGKWLHSRSTWHINNYFGCCGLFRGGCKLCKKTHCINKSSPCTTCVWETA